MGQGDRMRFGKANHAVTRAAQGRIHAKNDPMRSGCGAQFRSENRHGGPAGSAAEAFLHLLELPRGYAHERMLPAPPGLQKQKRRAPSAAPVFGIGQRPSMSRAITGTVAGTTLILVLSR